MTRREWQDDVLTARLFAIAEKLLCGAQIGQKWKDEDLKRWKVDLGVAQTMLGIKSND